VGRTLTLTFKELRQIFLSPIAYAFMMVFTFFVAWVFFRTFFLFGQATLSEFFFWFPICFAIFVPGIVMRVWAEERRQGTLEFLLTSPAETWQVVVAKFLGGAVLVTVCVLFTLLVPYTVAHYGDLDMGPVWGGYLGSILMGTTFVAIGMFCSAFTSDQIVSFLVGVALLMALVLIGHPIVQSGMEPGSVTAKVFRVISPITYFDSIGRGVVDIRDLYYFGGMTVIFLYLNTRVIDLRRWR